MSRPTESLSPEGATNPARSVGRTPVASRVGVGIACAAFGAIGFSGKAIIVKLGYRYGADAISMLVLRMGLAFPFFAVLAVVASRRRGVAVLSNGDRLKILVLGFLGYYLASFLDFLGLEHVSASLERLILYLNPTLVLLIGLMFLHRRTNPRQIVALIVGYSGVVVAFAHDLRLGGGNIALGGLLVFASALSYAIYLVVSGELVQRVGTLRLTAYASCVAALCCVVHFALTRPIASLATMPAPVYGLSLLNATACTVLPVFAVMISVSRLGAGVASQIGMVGPVSTIVLADLFLDERMGLFQIVGTALVLVGVFIVSQGGAARSAPAISTSIRR
jgi:drug/metabolite transporter (DMT)-like permease